MRGAEQNRSAASPPSEHRPLRPATFTPVPSRAARRDAGGRGTSGSAAGPVRAGRASHRAPAPTRPPGVTGSRGRRVEAPGSLPLPHPAGSAVPPSRGPRWWCGPEAAALPGGSDGARRLGLPARRQRWPGRRSPGRRSLPPPPAVLAAQKSRGKGIGNQNAWDNIISSWPSACLTGGGLCLLKSLQLLRSKETELR